MNRKIAVFRYYSILFSMLLLVTNSINGLQAQVQQKEKTLYERLGGVYSIATVVDDFIERLLVNDILNANPAINEARDRVPKAGLKFRLTELVCQATGGPEKEQNELFAIVESTKSDIVLISANSKAQ